MGSQGTTRNSELHDSRTGCDVLFLFLSLSLELRLLVQVTSHTGLNLSSTLTTLVSPSHGVLLLFSPKLGQLGFAAEIHEGQGTASKKCMEESHPLT
jgi:hypothetical protein